MTRRRRRLWLLVGVVIVLAWAAAAAASLLRARSDLEAGLASVRRAQKLTSPADLVDGRPQGDLREAARSFDRGHDRLASPVVAPLKLLPVLGRQLRSATALADTAARVSAVGSDAVADAQRALRLPHETGPERVALLRELGEVARRAAVRLDDLDLGPRKALIGTLAERRAELEDRLADLRETLRDGGTSAGGLADLLQGPRRYLVLAANNSEMRAGTGMFLSVGEMTFADGGFSLGEFQPAAGLYRDEPPPITDVDFAARWGWLSPNKEWRNLGASPRFDVSAELATRMWGRPVDGVLSVDPIAVQALVEATGPVDVAGRRLEADAVDDFLLYEQYVGIKSFDTAAQAGRREVLGLLAKAAFDNVDRGGWEVGRLASSLARAARGRHIMAWSARPEEQRVWEGMGIDGRLHEDSLAVSVLNRGGNKLDRFLDVKSELSVDTTRAQLRVTLVNTAPADTPVYVAGPYPGSPVGAGDYFGILSVNFPGWTGNITSDAGDPAAAGADGPTRVHAVPVTVRRGETKTVTFSFDLGRAPGSLVVEPSARVPAVTWTAPGSAWKTNERRRLTW